MTRFVALGDSTTAGYGDPMPDGRWRGWAALLADGIGATEFTNLGASGALAADVAATQLPAALALRPSVAAVLVGVNDTLRDRFDVSTIGAAIDQVVRDLSDCGAVVLTVCLPDPARMFRLPAVLGRPLARRIRAVNAIVHGVAERYSAAHLHLVEMPSVYDSRMWSIDRLHPGERGHRLLAGWAYDSLAAHGVPVCRRPDPEPDNPPPTVSAQLVWLATEGTRWLIARSTDLVPYLMWMAAVEWWYDRRGIPRPDHGAQHEMAADPSRPLPARAMGT